jgi:hypothetical protein
MSPFWPVANAVHTAVSATSQVHGAQRDAAVDRPRGPRAPAAIQIAPG